ncbi:Gfo/Idh/MocA family protein [Candidatus Lokiarchaeum ossiferum]|uniref:Gfo/Idh/MocA family protein n=1 Tax=Candidatus Lokiarchaeum ossiferum TaxID=2951803 RepID=UPI00352CCA3C
MPTKIRWGILGCGKIAHSFALSMQKVDNSEIIAVASRTPEKGANFADQYNVPTVFTTYEELATYPDLDVIYIATTHNFHYANMLLCLEHNKSILCEKAFTLNQKQAENVFQIAKEKQLFVMEGMWMKFNPCFRHLQKFIAEGNIGDVRLIKADFGVKFPFDPTSRLYNRELAGGALLDLGIYPLTFARAIFGHSPLRIESTAYLGETGVDEESSYFLEFADKKQAMLFSSCRVETLHEATIFGTAGRIKIPDFFHPSGFEWKRHNKHKVRKVEVQYDFPGYQYEIEEVNRCLREGKLESELMSHADSLEMMGIMDTLRHQWNLKYPDEIE